LDLERQQIASVELTGPEGGETLLRHNVSGEQIVLADRGYGHREGVASVLETGGRVVVRLASNNFPLKSPKGARVSIPRHFRGLRVGQVKEWRVQFEARGGVHPMRLVAVRKTAAAAEKEQRRLRHEAKRKGREPDQRSLQAAHFIVLLTNLPAREVRANQVAELYRLRWQIETYFKRLKSILHIDHLRTQKPDASRAYLFAKLLGAILIDQLWGDANAFSPWGYALPRTGDQPLARNGVPPGDAPCRSQR
jgi:IS4 transposase